MVERNERGAAPAAGLDTIHPEDEEHTTAWDVKMRERERIRTAMRVRCGKVIEMAAARGRILCGLNLGHIGGCSQIAATITISKERLEEILDG